MHKLKLLCLAALALFAFGAFTTSALAVEAEEENNPRVLVTEGKIADLTATLTAEAEAGEKGIELIPLEEKNIITAKTAVGSIKNCDVLSEKDTNLCKDQLLTFTGVKQGAVACRSENAKGEKDPIETVLTLLDLHAVAQLNAAKELVPALQAKVLGTALEEEVKFNCGTTKIQVKGVIECLVGPGLVVTKNVEVLCKVQTKTGTEPPKPFDPIVGTCNVLCADFGTVGLLANLDGKTFKDAWELIHLLGTTNKSIFIDD